MHRNYEYACAVIYIGLQEYLIYIYSYINMLIHVRVGLDIETSVESIIHESQIYRKRFLASAVPSI